MARGLILSTPTRAAATSTSIIFMARTPLSFLNYKVPKSVSSLPVSSPRLLCCKSSLAQQPQVDIDQYKEAFSKRMAMAGLKPHHRIALGVSGGPDSMALCFLTAAWKTEGSDAVRKSSGFDDGLLAIVVDHGLRAESKEEAHIVSHRVSQMGIRCEISQCSWLDGKPKQGHLQEAAREKRYQIFQNVCSQHQIGVLLIAHHADDQAELFILRLSRNSGVLGLAGMAFTSQVFSLNAPLNGEGLKNEGILLVRPLLRFCKEDMYKICQGAQLQWVEDPTNRSSLYARNRIRMSLGGFSSYTFRSELQAVISACRKTRLYVDQISSDLISKAVTIMDHQGYAIIDLQVLNPSMVNDICLSKFVSMVLQFISQRQRQVRGSTLKLLLDYICAFPCKTSLTASGCYLCPAPGSRGTKVLVCCSVNGPLPSTMELNCTHSIGDHNQCVSSELGQIIADGRSCEFVPNGSDAHFLELKSESVLTEAKRLNIISESTYINILLLQRDEIGHFKDKSKDKFDCWTRNDGGSGSVSSSKPLLPGQLYYFMNRFLISWILNRKVHEKDYNDLAFGGKNHYHDFRFCGIDHNMVPQVRHMIESDWLYFAKLSNCLSLDVLPEQNIYVASNMEQTAEDKNLYLDYLRLSAKRALLLLKSIPVAARRSLPVLVDGEGKILSIPRINFNSCPCLMVSCVFKPRVPLGGGHSSFA